MGDLFKKPNAEPAPKMPNPNDERARMAAMRELEKTGGKATTVLTSGLAAPIPRTPNVTAPRSVLTS